MGHGCCTALAVIGGRYVSTKISVKHGTDLLSYPAFDDPELTLFFLSSHTRRKLTLHIIRLYLPLRSVPPDRHRCFGHNIPLMNDVQYTHLIHSRTLAQFLIAHVMARTRFSQSVFLVCLRGRHTESWFSPRQRSPERLPVNVGQGVTCLGRTGVAYLTRLWVRSSPRLCFAIHSHYLVLVSGLLSLLISNWFLTAAFARTPAQSRRDLCRRSSRAVVGGAL